MTRRSPAKEAWHAAELSAATDEGAAWHAANPDALLVDAWRRAAELYPDRDHQAHAFTQAFRNARAQRDAYHQEESQ